MEILDDYISPWYQKLLLAYILVSIAIPWYVIWYNKRIKPDPTRDIDKFKPWVRHDTEQWSYFISIFTHIFLIPRFIIAFQVLPSIALVAAIVSIG